MSSEFYNQLNLKAKQKSKEYKMKPIKDPVKITKAAIWVKKSLPDREVNNPTNIRHGEVFTGNSHDYCIVMIQEEGYDVVNKFDSKVVCGFITNCNKFVNRLQAAFIAYEAGQTKELRHELQSTDIDMKQDN